MVEGCVGGRVRNVVKEQGFADVRFRASCDLVGLDVKYSFGGSTLRVMRLLRMEQKWNVVKDLVEEAVKVQALLWEPAR